MKRHDPGRPTPHATLEPGDRVEWEVADGLTTLVHVFSGGATVNGTDAVDGQMVVLDRDHGDVEVGSTDGAEVLPRWPANRSTSRSPGTDRSVMNNRGRV